MKNDFSKFAKGKTNVSDSVLRDYQNYITPYIMEERELRVTQLDVFSRMMMERVIFLGAAIDADVANVIQAQLLYLESTDDSKDIQIYINSPGGSVYAGLGIYDTMQFIKPKIATTCTGIAGSMSAILLASGTHSKRFALQHSRILTHQPSGGASGQESDIEIMAKEIKTVKKELYEILANHTGQTIAKIAKDSHRDYWMTSVQAKKYGIIDKILIPNKS